LRGVRPWPGRRRRLIEWQLDVEHRPGAISPRRIRSMRCGRYPRTGAGPPRRWTWEKNSSSPVELDAVRDVDVAETATGSGGTDGLHHRLLGADCLDDRVGSESPPVSSLIFATPRRRVPRRCRLLRTPDLPVGVPGHSDPDAV
jgi:hypothetical protein